MAIFLEHVHWLVRCCFYNYFIIKIEHKQKDEHATKYGCALAGPTVRQASPHPFAVRVPAERRLLARNVKGVGGEHEKEGGRHKGAVFGERFDGERHGLERVHVGVQHGEVKGERGVLDDLAGSLGTGLSGSSKRIRKGEEQNTQETLQRATDIGISVASHALDQSVEDVVSVQTKVKHQ